MKKTAAFALLLAAMAGCGPAEGDGGADPGLPLEDLSGPDITLVDLGAPDEGPADAGDEEAGIDASADAPWVPVACQAHGDCSPGACVETPEGTRICAPDCRDRACPDGWSCRQVDGREGETLFLCLYRPTPLCRPCDRDAECRLSGVSTRDYCVPFGPAEGSFCGRDCTGSDCPAGWECREATLMTGEKAHQCLPVTGVCECIIDFLQAGIRTTCRRESPYGSCPGQRRCDMDGLTACDAQLPEEEVCGNGLDEDCDGETDEAGCLGCTKYYKDADQDGWGAQSDSICGSTPEPPYTATRWGDCDDDTPTVHPEAVETCNSRDDDCNGLVDEGNPVGCVDWYLDSDDDGVGRTGTGRCLCAALGEYRARDAGDCDDYAAPIHPGATESCNGVDDDCDGQIDDPGATGCKTLYLDVDADGHGKPGSGACLCGPKDGRTATVGDDCDDAVASTHPGAQEVCGNGRDDDCDGKTDEAGCGGCITFYRDDDGDGWGLAGDTKCLSSAAFPYTAAKSGDCNDQDDGAYPGSAEVCNGQDDDCDTQVDEPGSRGCVRYYEDRDADGFGGISGLSDCLCAKQGKLTATVSGDCDDTVAAVHPGATESCNGKDDDCDGLADPPDAAGCRTYFLDLDGDGWGAAETRCLCGPNDAYTAVRTGDCDDAQADTHPGTVEVCGNGDEDCDGLTDEDGATGCEARFRDRDGDGFGVAGDSRCTCAAAGEYSAPTAGDCNDGDASVSPGTPEACNGLDDDCDGLVDEEAVCLPRIGINADDGRSAAGAASGACACICEDDFNFLIADRLQHDLEADTAATGGGGTWKVFMVRTSTTQNPTLQSRIDYFNANKVDRLVTFSANSRTGGTCTSTDADGTETLIASTAGTATKSFATGLQARVVAVFGSRDRGVKLSSTSAILTQTTASAASVYYGFVTDVEDSAKIQDATMQSDLGRAALHAIQADYGIPEFTP